MSSREEPGFQEVLEAIKRALEDDLHLSDYPADEVARQLVLGGYVEGEPTVSRVADALASLEAEEQAFGPDVPTEEV
jgi:hypothetical protein